MSTIKEEIRVMLVDDHRLFSKSIDQFLNRYRRFYILDLMHDGSSALDYLASGRVLPQVMLLDIAMPHTDGYHVLKTVKKKWPEIRVIMLSMFDSPKNIMEAIGHGANGYLDKTITHDELVTAIDTVMEDKPYYSQMAQQIVSRNVSLNLGSHTNFGTTQPLTSTELKILTYICDELTNGEIAAELNRSRRTIETIRKSIMVKTGSTNTAGLVKYAYKNGLVE